MNTKFYLLPLLLLAVLFASCEETKEVSIYDNWQPRNEAFLDSLQAVYDNGIADKEGRKLERFELLTAPGTYLLFKRLTPVTATPPVGPDGKVIPGREYEYINGYVSENIQPLYTDNVTLFYKGSLINKTRFDGFEGATPTIFDSPNAWAVNDPVLIAGWPELLQRMSVGERWEVYIPSSYGYGAGGMGAVLGYSTLIFDIQLYSIESLED